MNPTKSEAIKKLLTIRTWSDLAELYSLEMECQVNVGQDNGEKTEGHYQGKAWRGWTDGATVWKPFRIPYGANSDPKYEDEQIRFDLAAHAEGIGMTGWNWKRRLSFWVAFDFDAITGHSDRHKKKLTEQEIKNLIELVQSVSWVTLRKSTGGGGLHLYVFLDPVPTSNHTEHAALARSILAKLSVTVQFDFSTKVDVCGGNMWVWHRKMTPQNEGLKLIKQGEKLFDIPQNWRDHIQVARGTRKRNLPQFIEEIDREDAESLFEELTGQRTKIPLDNEHKRLVDFLSSQGALWWWDSDHHMLVTHTFHLKEAHESLQLKGPFKTIAQGTEKGIDHNCFMFPIRGGAWAVRRYSPGTQEAETWDQDGQGWTRCFLNRQPDLAIASRIHDGLEDAKGNYVFSNTEQALAAIRELGGNVDLPASVSMRKAKLSPSKKDNKVVMEFSAEPNDDPNKLKGWLNEKNKIWFKVIPITTSTFSEPEINLNLDDTIRHLVTTSGEDYGWVVKSEGAWRQEPISHVRPALESLGYTAKEVTKIIGSSVFRAWTVVNIPFGSEYPGDRQWNRNAPQLAYQLKPDRDNLIFPTWLKILNHLGKNLDDSVSKHPWCQNNGILSGSDYLMCWIASLFQDPTEPLPYLFLYGPQECGKSTLHEALKILVTSGVVRADAALTSQSAFNGELENAILCIIEETDLRKNKAAYNRIKDWVTSRDLLVHRKHAQPYTIKNTTHYIQCSNDHLSCPVFPNDTRITMIYVESLTEKASRKQFEDQLRREAPDFLTHIMSIELPPPTERLNLPIIVTDEKLLAEEGNLSFLETFIRENCFYVKGELIDFSQFCERYYEWLDPSYHQQWSRIRIGRELPPIYAKGRDFSADNKVRIGNISFSPRDHHPFKYVVKDGKLERVMIASVARTGANNGRLKEEPGQEEIQPQGQER
jgi:uncharacterized protein DUF5906